MSDVIETDENTIEVFTEMQQKVVSDMLANREEEIKKQMQSEIDRRVTNLVKENKTLLDQQENVKLQSMTEQERLQVELEKLRLDFSRAQQETERARVEKQKLELLSEKGFNNKYMDLIAGESLEDFENKLSIFTEMMKADIDKAVRAKFADSAEPKTGQTNVNVDGNPFSIDGENMTEAGRLYNTNKPEALKLIAKAKAAGKLLKHWNI